MSNLALVSFYYPGIMQVEDAVNDIITKVVEGYKVTFFLDHTDRYELGTDMGCINTETKQ